MEDDTDTDTEKTVYRRAHATFDGVPDWDGWEEGAADDGLDRGLAALGRSVMREAYQHGWSRQLQSFCSGLGFEEFLKRAPDLAERVCTVLLETDGLRIAHGESEHRGKLIEIDDFNF